MRDPWTARSNQSILKESNPEYSLEVLMLKLKQLQCFGHLMQRADSLEKTLMLGKTEGSRKMGQQRKRLLDGITDSMDMSLNKFLEIVKDREAWSASVHGVRVRQSSSTVEQSIMHVIGLQCRRCGFYPWVEKIPWRSKLQPTYVFLPRESHGHRYLSGGLQFMLLQKCWT